jgi:type IV secretion system protein TrbE
LRIADTRYSWIEDALEKRFDGAPTLMILDEAWLYLTESLFAAKIREWLKVLRKKNVAVIFATQSLSDIADSVIAPAIIENCPTRIFLPNGNAMEERTRKVYESFGLNERQLQILQPNSNRHRRWASSPAIAKDLAGRKELEIVPFDGGWSAAWIS